MLKTNYKIIAVIILSVFAFVTFFAISPVLANYGDRVLNVGTRGDDVRNLQRDLTSIGFNTYGADGIFGNNTYNAVVNFQRANGLLVDGIVGNQTKNALSNMLNRVHIVQSGDTLYKLGVRYGTTANAIMQANNLNSTNIYPGTRLVIPSGSNDSTSNPSQSTPRYGELADWWTVVDRTWRINQVATITDIDTGIIFQVKRYGGGHHADVEPINSTEAAKMKQAYGGQWSWARRAVLVTVNGRTFAGSMNGMPHAGQSIWNNNFNGHFCIHFLNSRTHGTNKLDPAHQAMVRKAAGR